MKTVYVGLGCILVVFITGCATPTTRPLAKERPVTITPETVAVLASAIAENKRLGELAEKRKQAEAQKLADEQKRLEQESAKNIPTGFKAVGAEKDSASGLPMTLEHTKTGYRLKLIPAGIFLLGSPDGEGAADEHPQKQIYLDPYWIGETEVTCEQYAQFLNEKGNTTEGGATWCGLAGAVKIEQAGGKYQAKAEFKNHPVVEVSWYGARAFADWLGGQLPTEPQWEKAAKGDREVKWPWGNSWDKNNANTAERLAGVAEFKTPADWLKWWESVQRKKFGENPDFSDTTVPVRSYRPNGYGLYDMAGNVCEWCADYYAVDAYKQLRNSHQNPLPVASGDVQNLEYWQGGEKKTDKQQCRVVRGGGWNLPADFARCAVRGRYQPAIRGTVLGVRVVVSPRP